MINSLCSSSGPHRNVLWKISLFWGLPLEHQSRQVGAGGDPSWSLLLES